MSGSFAGLTIRSESTSENVQERGLYRSLWNRIRPHLHRIATTGFCAVFIGLAASIDPLLIRHLIDYSLPHRQARDAYLTASLMAACFLGRAILSGTATLSGFKARQLIGLDIRTSMLAHLRKLSPNWHEQVKLGEKLDRFGADVDEISDVTSTAIQILTRAGIFFTINIVIMYRLNAVITSAFLPILPFFLLLRKRYRTSIRRQSDAAKIESGKTLATLAEQLGAMPQLELLGAGEHRLEKTVGAWKTEMSAKFRARYTEIIFNVTVISIFAISVLLVLGLSIHQVLVGALSTGSLVAFYSYVGQVFEPISTVMDLYSQSQQMRSSLVRIENVLREVPTVLDQGIIHESLSQLSQGIAFNRVSFGYSPPLPTLCDISLRIDSGEAVAIVGKSGSGKSTFARILIRNMEPSSGSISIDGREIDSYSLASLRKTICYLPQQTTLFAGTIRENLLYGNLKGTEDQLERAVKAASFDSVVKRVSLGLDHELGPDGLGLSGGERQRLAIARSLLRDSAVLVMDEATSALDKETEKGVLEALSQFKSSKTMVLISHRLQSLHWVNRFFLLDSGRLAAEGSLSELLATSALFRELYDADADACVSIAPTPTGLATR
jgi:ABC-type bacteriocin/lantibiotic exporter with double-glycine peptidase domain